MKNLFACLMIALLALFVLGCAQQSSPPASNPTPSAPEPGASKAMVEIKGFAFSPASIEVSAGTTVTWKNSDSVSHTATGDAGEFDTGNIQGGGEGSYTFNTPGTYAYHCALHPSMKGTVVVK